MIVLISLVIVIAFIFSVLEYKNNYTSTIEEAAKKANIKYDEIYVRTETKDRILIIYGDNEKEVFSIGLLKKNWLGYQWIMGSGIGKDTKANLPPVTIAMTNLPMENHGNIDDLVSVAYGSVLSDQITQISVRFDEMEIKTAEIIDTSMGRKWYAISDSPINKDPQIIGIDKEEKEIYRNY
jgi:hypothetical protein